MPPKRQNEARAVDELSGRERKKQKTAIARTIAVQPDAGPSNTTKKTGEHPPHSVRFDSMKGMPGALDVERFAESRAFEIQAMQEAMHNARVNKTHRAWQQLPRHLRRRAASHDVRRVPLRVRDKARAEMDPARQKASGRKDTKSKQNRRIQRNTWFAKRQQDKTWLETHVWHAKRMHMQTMWGYQLAVTPTEKSFRPSHRASVHGSILHDASYMATIEIKGPQDILRATLDGCCDCQGPSMGAIRFLTGARTAETHLYAYNKYPYKLVGPAAVQWQADSPQNVPVPPQKAAGKKSKGKEKEKSTTGGDTEHRVRVVWIRVHPSMAAEAHEVLRLSAAFTLDAVKKTGRIAEVEMADLREQFNMFEIIGSKASQVIKGVLRPVEDQREQFQKFWASLNRLQSSGAVPRGMVIGFTVHDPRLSFPPKNAKLVIEDTPTPTPSSIVFPSASLAQSNIWDEAIRMGLRKPRFKKKELDSRRSNNLVPGSTLKSERKDDRVPVLLVQRSIENALPSQSSSSSHSSATSGLHGWTLIVPQGWGMPFLSSLVYTGTRVAGQREQQTQFFEAGCPHFPHDFPTTEANDVYAEAKEDDDKERWERKPPAKRPNYDKLGTRSPWRADWGVVLGLEEPPLAQELEEFIEAQRGDTMDVDATAPAPGAADGDGKKKKAVPWLLRGPDVREIVADVATTLNPAARLLDRINQQREKRKLGALGADSCAEDLVSSALVQVSVTLAGRGSPEELAGIYRIRNEEEARKWFAAETARKNGLSLLADGPSETELSEKPALSKDLIGYVTTSDFSLSLGEGHAIGAISLAQHLELHNQAQRIRNDGKLLVKVRNRNETVFRAAYIQLV